MKSLIQSSAKYVCLALCLVLGVISASHEAFADRRRDQAFKHFSQGKLHYQQKRYQSAEESFSQSLEYMKDHQSLYYKALSIAKQARPCDEISSAWRTYLDFCKKRKNNCVDRWIKKAKGHYKDAIERCASHKVPRTISGDCPKGSSLIVNECVVSTMECPAGTILHNQKCVTPPKCSQGMSLRGLECVDQEVTCPLGSARQGTRCVTPADCGSSTYFVEGVGCKMLTINQPTVSSGNVFTMTPWWGYTAVGLGVVSHIINLLSTSGGVLDTTFITTLTGYGIGGIGIGVGVYRSLIVTPPPTAAQESLHSSPHHRSYIPNHTPRSLVLRWSVLF